MKLNGVSITNYINEPKSRRMLPSLYYYIGMELPPEDETYRIGYVWVYMIHDEGWDGKPLEYVVFVYTSECLGWVEVNLHDFINIAELLYNTEINLYSDSDSDNA